MTNINNGGEFDGLNDNESNSNNRDLSESDLDDAQTDGQTGAAEDSGGEGNSVIFSKEWRGRVGGKNARLPDEVLNKKVPKPVRNEIYALFKENHKKRANGKRGVVSIRTDEIRWSNVWTFFKVLFFLKYKIQSVYHLKQKHLIAVFNYMESKGQSPKTIVNCISTLRTFCDWLGKDGMMMDSKAYVVNPDSVKVSSVAIVDKSWEAKRVDPITILNDINSYMGGKHEVVGVWLELCWAFGMRRKEAILFSPSKSVDVVTQSLLIEDGTKGGRPRVVPITEDYQRYVLDKALAFENSATGFLGPRFKTIEQKIRYFRHVMESIGVTLSEKEISAHGLRHEYIHRQHEVLTGVKAPIKGGDIRNLDKLLYRAASKSLMERVGHSRASIGASYYGSRQGVRQQKSIKIDQEGLLDGTVKYITDNGKIAEVKINPEDE